MSTKSRFLTKVRFIKSLRTITEGEEGGTLR